MSERYFTSRGVLVAGTTSSDSRRVTDNAEVEESCSIVEKENNKFQQVQNGNVRD